MTKRDEAIDKLGLLLSSSGREHGCAQADVAAVVDALIEAARAAESEHTRSLAKQNRKAGTE